jgi:hypothetical protein
MYSVSIFCATAFFAIKLEHAFTGKITDVERFFAKLDPKEVTVTLAKIVAGITAVQLGVGGLMRGAILGMKINLGKIARWLQRR